MAGFGVNTNIGKQDAPPSNPVGAGQAVAQVAPVYDAGAAATNAGVTINNGIPTFKASGADEFSDIANNYMKYLLTGQEKLASQAYSPQARLSQGIGNLAPVDAQTQLLGGGGYNTVNGRPQANNTMSVLSGIGQFAKGFSSAYDNARAGAAGGGVGTGMDLAKIQDMQIKASEAKQKVEQNILPVMQDYNKNGDVLDETTRAQAIGDLKTLLNNPDSMQDRLALPTAQKLLAVIVRPDVKRLGGTPNEDLGTIQGIVSSLFGKGAFHADEFATEATKGHGVLAPATKAELTNIADNFIDLSQQKFATAASPYFNVLDKAGLGKEAPNYLAIPKWPTATPMVVPAYAKDAPPPPNKIILSSDEKDKGYILNAAQTGVFNAAGNLIRGVK